MTKKELKLTIKINPKLSYCAYCKKFFELGMIHNNYVVFPCPVCIIKLSFDWNTEDLLAEYIFCTSININPQLKKHEL